MPQFLRNMVEKRAVKGNVMPAAMSFVGVKEMHVTPHYYFTFCCTHSISILRNSSTTLLVYKYTGI